MVTHFDQLRWEDHEQRLQAHYGGKTHETIEIVKRASIFSAPSPIDAFIWTSSAFTGSPVARQVRLYMVGAGATATYGEAAVCLSFETRPHTPRARWKNASYREAWRHPVIVGIAKAQFFQPTDPQRSPINDGGSWHDRSALRERWRTARAQAAEMCGAIILDNVEESIDALISGKYFYVPGSIGEGAERERVDEAALAVGGGH